jgi:sulfur-oxidizing protein SoxY
LRATLAGSALAVAAGAGLVTPSRVLAAAWPSKAFDATKAADAITALYGAAAAQASDAIKVSAPIQAEDGASVPVAVSTEMAGIESIAIVVHENARPLATHVAINGGAGYYRANLKMGKTSKVDFLVKAGGKLYVTTKDIKVTRGGCGG